jgi:hypothetical protein
MILLLALALQAGPYDADPKHPWNELHRALFTWRPIASKTKVPAGLEADPLFWPIGFEEWTFSASLLPVLDGLLEKGAAADPKDPLQRAVLQHDLWTFFDGLEGMPLANSRSWPPEDENARDAARRRLARLMRRIALTPEEIRALPDNLSAAVSSGRHAKAFDPAQPDRPFLPADLLDPKGPWVLLGREDGAPVAEQHVKHFRRSAFFVHASVPGGPDPTLAYLRDVGRLKKAKLVDPPPDGTRFLFVRRAFLLDAEGRPHLSPLTEEVRIRVSPTKSTAAVFEFHLKRGDLFGGTAGGLQATATDEEAVLFFFNRGASKEPIRRSCVQCHGATVLPGVALRYAGRDPRTREGLTDGVPLRVTTMEKEAEATLKARETDRWTDLLRKFWPKE